MQVVGTKVNGADPAKAVGYLVSRFVSKLFCNAHNDRETGCGVERGSDNAAMQAAVDEVTNQVGAHVEAERRGRRIERAELEVECLMKGDAFFKYLAQHYF